ncbi:hypothetical protein JCM24511_03840 [Saitozyma sp. JCM 24511]|nr:hypothetical protein JCM24511_03840 [Saitozyma sp. JCM 24511]
MAMTTTSGSAGSPQEILLLSRLEQIADTDSFAFWGDGMSLFNRGGLDVDVYALSTDFRIVGVGTVLTGGCISDATMDMTFLGGYRFATGQHQFLGQVDSDTYLKAQTEDERLYDDYQEGEPRPPQFRLLLPKSWVSLLNPGANASTRTDTGTGDSAPAQMETGVSSATTNSALVYDQGPGDGQHAQTQSGTRRGRSHHRESDPEDSESECGSGFEWVSESD